MEHTALTFDNKATIRLRCGQTGEIKAETEVHNDISDEMLASANMIYLNSYMNNYPPICCLFPDGPLWASFTWDRTNPWCPYMYTLNNTYQGNVDATANSHYAGPNWTFDGTRHRLWYQWTKLADDFQLKAIGLTAWDAWVAQFPQCYGMQAQPVVFHPQSLVVLPTSFTIKGRKGGLQVPDTLEISYYLSLVGVN